MHIHFHLRFVGMFFFLISLIYCLELKISVGKLRVGHGVSGKHFTPSQFNHFLLPFSKDMTAGKKTAVVTNV